MSELRRPRHLLGDGGQQALQFPGGGAGRVDPLLQLLSGAGGGLLNHLRRAFDQLAGVAEAGLESGVGALAGGEGGFAEVVDARLRCLHLAFDRGMRVLARRGQGVQRLQQLGFQHLALLGGDVADAGEALGDLFADGLALLTGGLGQLA